MDTDLDRRNRQAMMDTVVDFNKRFNALVDRVHTLEKENVQMHQENGTLLTQVNVLRAQFKPIQDLANSLLEDVTHIKQWVRKQNKEE